MSAGTDIRIEKIGEPVTIKFEGAVLASSEDELMLHESGHDPVIYFPRGDVYLEHMTRIDKTTTCPHKGEANYYRISTAGAAASEAAWTYESPKDAVSQIAGYIAFYADKVEIQRSMELPGVRPGG